MKNKILIKSITTVLLVGLVFILVTPSIRAMSADVKCVDSKGKALSGDLMKACKAYIQQYNNCDKESNTAKKTKCRNDAYVSYAKEVCPSGGGCVDNRDKVIAKLNVASADGVGDTGSGQGGGGGANSGAAGASSESGGGGQSGGDSVGDLYGDPKLVPIEENPIIEWINIFLNLFASIVGIGATIMIIYGGIQYITARDNAQSVTAAKQKIINAIIGLFAFGFLYAFINWLVPGGVF